MFITSMNLKFSTNSSITNGYIDIEEYKNEFANYSPNIGWIFIENGQITKYEFYYDNYFILNVNGNIREEEIDYSTLINARDYGIVGDGVTDDTVAIQNLLAYLNVNGGIAYFPTATYVISTSASGQNIFNIQTNKDICIDFFGSTFTLKENAYPNYNVIKVDGCENVEIRNGTLIGDRLKHDYVTVPGTHEFGYGIYFSQTQNGLAYNMDISNMTGDAIINKNGESGGNTKISNCNLHHCRRQGISILDSDVIEIEYTNIYNIGTFDGINGIAPMTGIDIEPASGTQTVNNISINKVQITDTTSFGIINVRENLGDIEILNSMIYSPNITNATIKNSSLIFNLSKGLVLKNSNIESSNIKLNIEKSTIFFYGNIVNNCYIEGKNEICGGRILGNNSKVQNTTFKNLTGTGNYSTNSKLDFGIVFADSYNYQNNSGNNTYNNCAMFVGTEVNDLNSSIESSVIYVTDSSSVLNRLKINNCNTRSNSVASLTLNHCEISNSGTFGNCKKLLKDTNFTVKDIDSGFPVGSTCDNSIIKILGTMPIRTLNNIAFSNNSKVILEKYNDTNKIINSYSTINEDYTVEYNGTETLN